MGKGTIYRYFADKDNLYFQVTLAGFDKVCELLQRKVPEKAPFAEQLLRACGEITSFFNRRRHLFRMMLAEETSIRGSHAPLHEQWLERRKALVAVVSLIIREGVEEGRIHQNVQCNVLANYFLGITRTRSHRPEGSPEPMRRHELLINLFLSGAGRPTGVTGPRWAHQPTIKDSQTENPPPEGFTPSGGYLESLASGPSLTPTSRRCETFGRNVLFLLFHFLW